ncbi:unnamed protein product [Mytilus coruscus]|uniref:MACPF domain-containing protein n=1 Tax=Mytilus coruscus TaxID=42192 RepID=A0A6J8DJ78_MYTCO|nr:unnamed protein product [Mytilus coruscus]
MKKRQQLSKEGIILFYFPGSRTVLKQGEKEQELKIEQHESHQDNIFFLTKLLEGTLGRHKLEKTYQRSKNMKRFKQFPIFILIINVGCVLLAPVYEHEPIDDLVEGFRRQQMVMSTTLINASQTLGLPGKLAEAEVEEAEERAMLAFRRKNEAKTPFIATSSQLNLGYIGRGYDIYMGNPMDDVGEVDQGFRFPVIDLPFSFRFTSDGGYRIPDNVDVISETSASFGSSYHQVKTETDYQSMLQVDASVNAAAGGYGVSGSFSASTSYKKSVKEVTKGETTTLQIVGRANVYKARLSSIGTISKVSDFFEDNIRALPSENCEEDVVQQLYIQVIEQFGTHYTTEVVMGAKAVQESKFKNSDLDKFQSVGISAKVAAQMSAKVGAFSASAGFSVGVNSNDDMRKKVSNTEKEQREYYIGGSPPSGDYSSGSTESLREWARSAAENPVPIQYKLSSIDALIRPKYFKKSETGLFEKRHCFRKALYTYCTSSIAANHCSLKSESTTDGNPGTFRYGDFVTIRNRNRYLSLSQNFGISPGLTIKPLTTVTAITNYDGLFQLVSPEGENEKLGMTLHYGEPFLLKTIEGDMLHIGRSMILNDDEPEETRLLSLFEDQDEVQERNISYSPVTDYSIFLKKEEACSYLISLATYCSHKQTRRYHVEMFGTGGTTIQTVTVGNKTDCVCHYYSYGLLICSSFWYHTVAVAKDIGEIKKVRITGKSGESTYGIWQLQIRSMIDGVKRKVKWNWGYARDEVYEIKTNLKSSSTSIDSKIYPVQFTFQSNNTAYLEGQPLKVIDSGFIHILSSVPRESFWGQGMTNVVSLENTEEVGIKEIGPRPHKPLTAVCSDLIFPHVDKISKRHDFENQILISFEVKVRVIDIQIQSNSTLNFSLYYLHEVNKTFVQMDIEPAQENVIQKWSPKSPMYTRAIKISTTSKLENNTNITGMVDNVIISGCPSAILNTGTLNAVSETWTMEPSENVLKIRPYLHVVAMSKSKDPVTLFKDIQTQLSKTFSLTYQLKESQYDCAFNIESMKINIPDSELLFNIINITKISTKDGQDLTITIDITSLNKNDLNRGIMSLNSTIKTAIKNTVCSGQQFSFQTGSPAKTNDSSSFFTSNVWIIISICIGILQVITLSVLCVKTIRGQSIAKEERPIRLLGFNKLNEEDDFKAEV